MERREFIKSSCIACATVIGAGSIASILSSCGTLPSIKGESSGNMITLPESSFIENQNVMIVKNMKLDYDIFLVKKKDGTYNALYMQCSHQNQPLTATKTGLFCSTHGSSFDLEGQVKIQPATEPLKKFKTTVQNNTIQIQLI